MELNDLIEQLNSDCPNWVFDNANKRDLIDFLRHNDLERLQRTVATRLFFVARATHQWLLKNPNFC